MSLLAIDPGNTESGWCVIDADTRRPLAFGKDANERVLDVIEENSFRHLAIEMVASYGMAVGKDVFETCVWVGRFLQHNDHCIPTARPQLVYRRDIKLHHCGSAKAKDTNIRQALVDRFASGVRNSGKGTKAAPGWFYGFRADVWAAYAVAVYVADTAEAVVA
ncbi:MAG: hypothetical protein GEU78_09565 [Actinobacteria bacterium]|nr:hypothetical protein [Actinomycetota bacterium]